MILSEFRTTVSWLIVLLWVGALLPCMSWGAEERDFNDYPENVLKYLGRIYAKEHRQYAFRDDYPGGIARWRTDAREELGRLLGLDKIASSVGDHRPTVKLDQAQDLGDYTRRKGTIETEPDVRIPFWLLEPKGAGPWPLAILPHGHDPVGHDTYAGVYSSEKLRDKALSQDRDVAVQAVKHGFVALAPATRGLSANVVPDLYGRHDKRTCRSQLMHCLLANRTAVGERVWDMQRLLDWATKLPQVHDRHVLMMGNSGGGMVTIYAAACDQRITVAVPSCSFAPIASPGGYIFHCDCNMVPGIMEFGDLSDVAGLISPRHLLAVSGHGDSLHSDSAINRAAGQVGRIYNAAGCPQRFEHRWGNDGHRFYKDLMWPFILDALGQLQGSADR